MPLRTKDKGMDRWKDLRLGRQQRQRAYRRLLDAI